MKEKNIRIIFFIIIILLIIFSIYYIVKNKNTLSGNIEIKKENIQIDNNIILGITKFDTTNPILSKSQDIQYISKLIYMPLIDINKDFKLLPALAEEWNKIDNEAYLIKLKENIYWHNGQKFTSKDVEYTVDYIKINDSIYKDNVENIEKIEIINEYMIKIYLKEPEDNFEYMLCFPIICESENIGTGNFTIESILEDKMFLKSKDTDKKITIIIYDDMARFYNDFSSGRIDAFETDNINFQNYVGQVGYGKYVICGRKFDYLKFNLENKILSNPEIIKAINFAINKGEINNKIYNNLYVIAEFPMQYGSYLYNNEIKYEYNFNKAQKILEDAGWVYNRKKLDKKWTKVVTRTYNK